jgi:DNA-directed RNA polymerase I subunit RPA43
MSLGEALEPLPIMESLGKKDKSAKKNKSKDREHKRKRKHREGDEPGRHKSKKHRIDKRAGKSDSNAAVTESADSPFHVQTASMYLPLAPISLRQPLEGMCAEHLSPLILTHYPPLNGVILSYSSPRMSGHPYKDDGPDVLLKCIDDYAATFAWVTAEFLLFKPQRGGWLEGRINLQNEGHLGLVCWNLFNASIERQRLPKDWMWVGGDDVDNSSDNKDGRQAEESIGYYADSLGNKIEGLIRFRVKDIESSHDRERGFVSIEGTMLDEDEERKLLEKEISRKNRKNLVGGRLGDLRTLGATSLGLTVDHADGSLW